MGGSQGLGTKGEAAPAPGPATHWRPACPKAVPRGVAAGGSSRRSAREAPPPRQPTSPGQAPLCPLLQGPANLPSPPPQCPHSQPLGLSLLPTPRSRGPCSDHMRCPGGSGHPLPLPLPSQPQGPTLPSLQSQFVPGHWLWEAKCPWLPPSYPPTGSPGLPLAPPDPRLPRPPTGSPGLPSSLQLPHLSRACLTLGAPWGCAHTSLPHLEDCRPRIP